MLAHRVRRWPTIGSMPRVCRVSHVSGYNAESEVILCCSGKESKTARKRRKRREIASRAADDELAEISIEQQMLAELGNKGTGRTASAKAQEQQKPTVVPEPTPPAPSKPAASSRVKSKTPIALNIADMISALEVCMQSIRI